MSNVRDNRLKERFELEADGHLAVAQYHLKHGTITFTHTIVPEELEGRGIGGQLARAALDTARSEGLAVVPKCPFIRAYIERHPEYQDLVA
jgi:hypothetical protein